VSAPGKATARQGATVREPPEADAQQAASPGRGDEAEPVSAPPAVLLMGPTASGKSALALALFQRFAIEIVSVDSAQVYRGMDIGTAKPDAATRERVAHHLIDIIDPTDAYSAARFRIDALRAIAAIRRRGNVPLLVGGTMLYFKALADGLSALPAADAEVRARLDLRARAAGWPALHAELARIDPATAERLAPNDAQRIQRALEVFALTGAPMSRLQGARSMDGVPGATIAVALLPSDRARLHEAIARRFDAMLAAGLVDELRGLRRRFALTPDMPSMRCVGYRQAWEFLDGRSDAATLRAKGIAATRQLAKRQFTWLRATPSMCFDAQSPGIAGVVAAYLEARGTPRR
jgi:tRNA dimethylallyltransferase